MQVERSWEEERREGEGRGGGEAGVVGLAAELQRKSFSKSASQRRSDQFDAVFVAKGSQYFEYSHVVIETDIQFETKCRDCRNCGLAVSGDYKE